MNFLPPQPLSRRFFFWWLGLILLVVGAGIGGVLSFDRVLEKKVARLEDAVIEKRRAVSEAMLEESKEQKFYDKYQAFFTYRDTIERAEGKRQAWKEVAEAIVTTMPAGARLFQLQGLGNRLDGWALFPSMQEASDFVSKLAQEENEHFSEGWIDCVGDQCAAAKVKKEADKNHVIVRFHFTLQKEKESVPPSQGGD
jgi:Tfp pilus assembly protein PilN